MISRQIAIVLLAVVVLCMSENVSAEDLNIQGGPKYSFQFSGLTKVEGILLLLPQKQHTIYWVRLTDLDDALEKNQSAISVGTTPMAGELPNFRTGSGWEAIAYGTLSGKQALYLAYEDSAATYSDGRTHSVYVATVEVDDAGVTLGPVEHYRSLPKTIGNNYAYESLAWLQEGGLLAIPELSKPPMRAVVLGSSEALDRRLATENHEYRISDVGAANGSGTRLLATSFCWKGEVGACALTPDGRSRSRLLCLNVSGSQLTVVSDLALPLSVAGGDEEFNVEGIVAHRSGVVLVNDDYPGKTQSTLRYLSSEEIQKFSDGCLGP